MTRLGWNSLLSMGVHMMTTSMLTTCRCVLTLLESALCLGHCFSISNHPTVPHSCSFFCLTSCNLNYSAFIYIDVWNTWESAGNLNSMGVCDWVAGVLFDRVTTRGRSSLQLRVLCPQQSAISGGWSGRRMFRPWSCWHAAMNREE